MKPHEETWEFADRGASPAAGARLYSDNHEEEWATTWGEDSRGRARLAAQAPAMARLLLFRMGDRHCQYCGEKVDRVTDTGIRDPVYRGETLSLSKPNAHLKNCALIKVLRDAGVLE